MSLFRTAFSFAVLLIFTLPLFAQNNLSLQGTVRDENAPSVAGARISVSSVGVRFNRKLVTDGDGIFSFTALPAGNYRISVVAQTFGVEVRQFRISAKDTNTIDFVVQAVAVAAEVSVTSDYLAGSPESLGEVPGSVERIGGQSLENARVFNFSEALRKISGVNVRDEEGFGLRPNIGIRGTNPSRSTKILLLEDGLPLSYAPYGDNASDYHPPIER